MKNYRKREDVRRLMRNWKDDPCWDLWATEGFEAHEAELRKFQEEVKEERNAKHREEVEQTAIGLRCSIEVVMLFDTMQRQINQLEHKIDLLVLMK